MPDPPRLLPPLGHGIRGTDKYGSGAYGATRDGGTRDHLGVDLVVLEVGEHVVAPWDCEIQRVGYAYKGDLRFRSLWLVSREDAVYWVKMLYVQPKDSLAGEHYDAGDYIADAQDIGLRDPGITLHVHFELWQRTPAGDVRIDPTPHFGATATP